LTITSYYSLTTFSFFNDTAPTEIYTLSLHDALPISRVASVSARAPRRVSACPRPIWSRKTTTSVSTAIKRLCTKMSLIERRRRSDRKSTRLNSSHLVISYAVFCLKKKKNATYRELDV